MSDTTKEGGVKLPEPDHNGGYLFGDGSRISGQWGSGFVAWMPNGTAIRDSDGIIVFTSPQYAAAALYVLGFARPASPEPPPLASDANDGIGIVPPDPAKVRTVTVRVVSRRKAEPLPIDDEPAASDARLEPEGLSQPDGDGHWLRKRADNIYGEFREIAFTVRGDGVLVETQAARSKQMIRDFVHPGDRWVRLSPAPSSPPASPTAAEDDPKPKSELTAGQACDYLAARNMLTIAGHSPNATVSKCVSNLIADRNSLAAEARAAVKRASYFEDRANAIEAEHGKQAAEVARLSAENSKLKADLNGEAMIRKTGVRHMKELMERRDSLEDALRGARADVTRLSAELEAARRESDMRRDELEDMGRGKSACEIENQSLRKRAADYQRQRDEHAAELSREREARAESDGRYINASQLASAQNETLDRVSAILRGKPYGPCKTGLEESAREVMAELSRLRSREEETPKGDDPEDESAHVLRQFTEFLNRHGVEPAGELANLCGLSVRLKKALTRRGPVGTAEGKGGDRG